MKCVWEEGLQWGVVVHDSVEGRWRVSQRRVDGLEYPWIWIGSVFSNKYNDKYK